MKKLLLVAAGMIFTIQSYSQETKFGLMGGYLNVNASSSEGTYNDSENASGFFIGILADIALSEAFYLQPSVKYGNAGKSNLVSIPVLAKYYIANSGFNLVAGPQVSIIADQLPGIIKSVGFDIGFGAGYDINENIFLQAKYFMELTNRYRHVDGMPEDIDFKYEVNSLFVGLGYKF